MKPMQIEVQKGHEEIEWDDMDILQVFSCNEYKQYCLKISDDHFLSLDFEGRIKYWNGSNATNIQPVNSKLIIG